MKTSEPVASLPTVKAGLRAVPTKLYFVSLHSGAWGHKRAHTQANNLTPWPFHAVLPGGILQSHLPGTADQNHRQETDMGASAPTVREQTPFLRGQWQQQSEGEVLLNV